MNKEEDRTLWELTRAPKINNRIKQRAHIIRLSSQGWRVKKIAVYFKCSTATIERTIHRWKEKGLIKVVGPTPTGKTQKMAILLI